MAGWVGISVQASRRTVGRTAVGAALIRNGDNSRLSSLAVMFCKDPNSLAAEASTIGYAARVFPVGYPEPAIKFPITLYPSRARRLSTYNHAKLLRLLALRCPNVFKNAYPSAPLRIELQVCTTA